MIISYKYRLLDFHWESRESSRVVVDFLAPCHKTGEDKFWNPSSAITKLLVDCHVHFNYPLQYNKAHWTPSIERVISLSKRTNAESKEVSCMCPNMLKCCIQQFACRLWNIKDAFLFIEIFGHSTIQNFFLKWWQRNCHRASSTNSIHNVVNTFAISFCLNGCTWEYTTFTLK